MFKYVFNDDEKIILDMLLQNVDDKKIAQILGISLHTVISYKRKFKKIKLL